MVDCRAGSIHNGTYDIFSIDNILEGTNQSKIIVGAKNLANLIGQRPSNVKFPKVFLGTKFPEMFPNVKLPETFFGRKFSVLGEIFSSCLK